MRRWLRPVSTVLLVVGVLLAADAAITLLWKEPLSAIYAQVQQGKLDDGLAKLEGTEPNATDRKVLSHLNGLDRKLAYAARALNRRTDDGQPLGRIRMRKIGVDAVVVAGTRTPAPRRGPGHHPRPPLPGARGAAGVAPDPPASRAARATTPARRCRARAGPWRSPGTARPTARGSGGSTSSTPVTRSSCRCRTGASPTRSSSARSCRRRPRG